MRRGQPASTKTASPHRRRGSDLLRPECPVGRAAPDGLCGDLSADMSDPDPAYGPLPCRGSSDTTGPPEDLCSDHGGIGTLPPARCSPPIERSAQPPGLIRVTETSTGRAFEAAPHPEGTCRSWPSDACRRMAALRRMPSQLGVRRTAPAPPHSDTPAGGRAPPTRRSSRMSLDQARSSRAALVMPLRRAQDRGREAVRSYLEDCWHRHRPAVAHAHSCHRPPATDPVRPGRPGATVRRPIPGEVRDGRRRRPRRGVRWPAGRSGCPRAGAAPGAAAR